MTPQVVDHPSVIVVSNFSATQRREIFYQVHGAIAQMATYLRLPTNMPTNNGKPIVFVLSQEQSDLKIDADQIRRQLNGYLAEKGFRQSPNVAVHYAKDLDEDFLGTLYRKTASDFLATAHSDKPLPKWVVTALLQLGSQRDSQHGAFQIAKQLKVDGNLKRTLSPESVDVDAVLSVEFARQLYLTNPYAFSEFLFDLKHGWSVQESLEDNLGTTLQKQVDQFGRRNGVTLSPDSFNAPE